MTKKEYSKMIDLYKNLVAGLISSKGLPCSICCSVSNTSSSINFHNTKHNNSVYLNLTNQDKKTFLFLGLLNEDLEVRYYDLTINISMNWIDQNKEEFNNLIDLIVSKKINEPDLLNLGFKEHQFSETKKD